MFLLRRLLPAPRPVFPSWAAARARREIHSEKPSQNSSLSKTFAGEEIDIPGHPSFRTFADEEQETVGHAFLPADKQPSLTAEEKKEQGRQKRLLDKAKWSALGSLQTRGHSRGELQQKLLQKGHSPEHVQQTFFYLEEQSLLNDKRFASVFVSGKWAQNLWAPPRLRQELTARGVAQQDINAGLQATFGHCQADLAQPPFEFAMQDLPFLQNTQWVQARLGAADTAVCTAVQLVDACRARLRAPGSHGQQMKRLENWLKARMHSYSVIRLVREFLENEAAVEQEEP